MAVNPINIDDPARRAMLGIAENVRAGSGMLFTDEDLPDVDTPPQFDDGTDVDTDVGADAGEGEGVDNIRQSVLAGVNAQFEQNLADIKENALRTRRFNVGSTGDEELRALRIARNLGIERLGNLELTERQQILDALSPIAQVEAQQDVIRTQGEETRTTIGTQGEETRENIRTQGIEDRLTQQKQIDFEITIEGIRATNRLNEIKQQGTEQVESIEAQGIEDRLLEVDKRKTESEITGLNLQFQRDLAQGIVGGDADPTIYDALDFTDTLTDLQLADLVGLARDDIPEDGLSDEDRLNLTNRLLERNPELIPVETLEAKGARIQREVSKIYASVEERKVAVAENHETAMQSIRWAQHAVNQKVAEHGLRVSEAQMTGIWEAYGPEELEDFTASMNTELGNEDYNARYDFDGDGKVNFHDFTAFTKAASEGGVPTMALQQLREDSRQFDITDATQLTLLQEQITETARQFNLSQKQTRSLALHTLRTNSTIAKLQINVDNIEALVNLLIDAPGAITDEQGASIIASAMDLSNVQNSINVDEDTVFSAQNFAVEVDLITDPQILEWMQNPSTWDAERVDMDAIANDDDLRDWYEQMDFDRDGDVTMDDYAIFLANGGNIKFKTPDDQEGAPRAGKPTGTGDGGVPEVTSDTTITPELITQFVATGASREGIGIMLRDRGLPENIIETTLNSYFDADGNPL